MTCSGLLVAQQQTMVQYNAVSAYTNFPYFDWKSEQKPVDIYDWDSLTVQDDACAHETSSLDITRNANFLLFVQKAALCRAILTFLKAVRFKAISALLFH